MTYPVLIRTDTYSAAGGSNALVGTEHHLHEKVGNSVSVTKIADPTTVNAAIPRRIEVKTEGPVNFAVAPSPSLGSVGRGTRSRSSG